MTAVYLGIGSNINREQNIRSCLLGLHDRFAGIRVSRVFESEAVGIESQNFYNLVAVIETMLPLKTLSSIFRRIEKDFGRETGVNRYKSVAIDIDILLYGGLVGDFDDIKIPRAEVLTNAFVLQPMAEIASELIHPDAGKTYRELWAEYDKASQNLWPIDFTL